MVSESLMVRFCCQTLWGSLTSSDYRLEWSECTYYIRKTYHHITPIFHKSLMYSRKYHMFYTILSWCEKYIWQVSSLRVFFIYLRTFNLRHNLLISVILQNYVNLASFWKDMTYLCVLESSLFFGLFFSMLSSNGSGGFQCIPLINTLAWLLGKSVHEIKKNIFWIFFIVLC